MFLAPLDEVNLWRTLPHTLLGAADSILYQMSLQFDGNVVVYRKSNMVALWNSGLNGNGPWKLKLQLGMLMNVFVLQIRAALGRAITWFSQSRRPLLEIAAAQLSELNHRMARGSRRAPIVWIRVSTISTRWERAKNSVSDLEIGCKTVEPWGEKVNQFPLPKYVLVWKFHQNRQGIQGADGKEASLASSPPVPSSF